MVVSVEDPMVSHDQLDEYARRLEASGMYRVLRRLDLAACLSEADGGPTRLGMFLDIESTGLDVLSCEPIELAILPFEYRPDGAIVAVHPPLHQFNEPSEPITQEIAKITGITNDVVAGQKIDAIAVENFIKEAAVIVAHNAAFDRPIAERISSSFVAKPWACSMSDIDWRGEGFEGRRLSELLGAYGIFFEAHRAVDDCEAGVALLTQIAPQSGRRVLDVILSNARRTSWRIYAVDAPFDLRDALRQRGYRWNSAPYFGPRSWWIDVDVKEVEPELRFLEAEIFQHPVNLPMREITASDRYSLRTR